MNEERFRDWAQRLQDKVARQIVWGSRCELIGTLLGAAVVVGVVLWHAIAQDSPSP